MNLFDAIFGDFENSQIPNVEKANLFDEIRARAVDVEWEEVK